MNHILNAAALHLLANVVLQSDPQAQSPTQVDPVQDRAIMESRSEQLLKDSERFRVEGRIEEAERALGEAARSLLELTDALTRMGRFEDAVEKSQRALALYEQLHPGNHPAVASTLKTVASCLEEAGLNEDALTMHERAVTMYRHLHPGDHLEVATSISDWALFLHYLGRDDEALRISQDAVGMGKRLFPGDHPWVAKSQNRMSLCLFRLGHLDQALQTFQEALAMNRRLFDVDRPEIADCVNNVAICFQALGRLDEAVSGFEEVLSMRKRMSTGDDRSVAGAIHNVAACLQASGRWEEALTTFEEALAMKRRLFTDDRSELALTLSNTGGCLLELGRPREALPKLEEALSMYQRLFPGDHPEVAAALINLGQCFLDSGRPGEALPMFEQVLGMQRRLFPGDGPELANALNSLATCFMSLGRVDDALARCQEALAMWRRLFHVDHPDIALGLNNVAFCLEEGGSDMEALPLYEEGLAMRRRLYPDDHPAVAQNLNSLGCCLLAVGRREEALRLCEEALAMRNRLFPGGHPDRGASLSTLADCYESLGRTEDALINREAACEIARRFLEPTILGYATNLGDHYLKLGRFEQARERYAEAIAATEDFRAMATNLDEQDRASFFRALRGLDPYEGMVNLELRHGTKQEAIRYLELGRARSLLDLLERSKFDPLHQAMSTAAQSGDEKALSEIHEVVASVERTERTVSEMEHLARRISSRSDLDAAEREAFSEDAEDRLAAARAAHRAALRSRARLVKDHVGLATTAPCDELQGLVHPGEWMLLFSVGARDSHLFLIPSPEEDPQVFPLALGEEEIRKLVQELQQAIVLDRQRERGVEEIHPGSTQGHDILACRLFSLLIPEEVWQRIRDARRVYLIPDGALHQIPFEALVIEEREARTPTYWLDAGPPITYGTSGTVCLHCQRIMESQRGIHVPRKILAVGDPEFHGSMDESASRHPEDVRLGQYGELSRLPGTRKEVKAIYEAFTNQQSDPQQNDPETSGVILLLGKDATETNLFMEAPKARILHIATHYLVDETELASYSSLALTVPITLTYEDDGFLRIQDLLERWPSRLNGCELVVLSACETQKGYLQKDEGILSMPFGLLYAGVPSIIVSQWRVDDNSTAELMSDFYRRLLDPKSGSKLEAFTEARKALKENYPQPYFWAPFIYFGAP